MQKANLGVEIQNGRKGYVSKATGKSKDKKWYFTLRKKRSDQLRPSSMAQLFHIVGIRPLRVWAARVSAIQTHPETAPTTWFNLPGSLSFGSVFRSTQASQLKKSRSTQASELKKGGKQRQ